MVLLNFHEHRKKITKNYTAIITDKRSKKQDRASAFGFQFKPGSL